MNVLVTGGAGYIGSHTVRALLERGCRVVVLDNLSRGHRGAVPDGVRLVVEDIHHVDAVSALLTEEGIDAVMHFAAHSQVGESMEKPTIYYDNNVVGSYCLLEAVRRAGVKYVVFFLDGSCVRRAGADADYGRYALLPDERIRPDEAHDRADAGAVQPGLRLAVCGAAVFQRCRRVPRR